MNKLRNPGSENQFPEITLHAMRRVLAADPEFPCSPTDWLRALCADLVRWQGEAVDEQKLDKFIAGPLELLVQHPMLHPEARTAKANQLQMSARELKSKEERGPAFGAFFRMLYLALVECCAKSQLGIRAGNEAQAWHYLMLAQHIRARLQGIESLAGPNKPKLASAAAGVATAVKIEKALAREADALRLVVGNVKPTRDATAVRVAELAASLPRRERPISRAYVSKQLTKHFPGAAWPPDEAALLAKLDQLTGR